jgi:hypothetical protein
MRELAYPSIGGLCTAPGYIPSAANQYSLRDFHLNIMLNPRAGTLDRRVLARRFRSGGRNLSAGAGVSIFDLPSCYVTRNVDGA